MTVGPRHIISEDCGVDHWRYRCPHCESTQLRERLLDAQYLKKYAEVDSAEMRQSGLKHDDVFADVAQYYCRNCKTPVKADERIDTKHD